MSDALELLVPENSPFVDYEREFDFPAAEVFRTHSDPALFQQWRSVYPSLEAREKYLANGMESGMAAGYEQLEDLLA
jgi:hypothetical protein